MAMRSRPCLPTRWQQLSALASSGLVALVGILPMYIIPLGDSPATSDVMPKNLRPLLGLACGGLLGDTFLHVLPEVQNKLPDLVTICFGDLFLWFCSFQRLLWVVGIHTDRSTNIPQATSAHHDAHNIICGLWIIAGIMTFLVLEKLALSLGNKAEEAASEVAAAAYDAAGCPAQDSQVAHNNKSRKADVLAQKTDPLARKVNPSG